MRIRGAVRHAWLDPWLDQAGVRRWAIWGGRETGMPAFPRGVSAPAFLLGAPKQGSRGLDVLTGRSAGTRTGPYAPSDCAPRRPASS